MDQTNEFVLQIVLIHLAPSVHDLLHVARVNKRLYRIVATCEAAWQAAYERYFDSNPVAGAGGASHADDECVGSWREKFKSRFIKSAKATRLYVAARRSKARSQVQVLRQETFRFRQKARKERRTCDKLQNELSSARSARQHSGPLTHSYWLPRAVLSSSGSVIHHAHRGSHEYEQELSQKLSVSKLEIMKLERMLQSRKTALAHAERKLAALEP
jgi:hypothetical protein